ncbi:MAG: HesA/MoeB/ThiF family protein [Deltaproteobacteria bacterium]|nr:HesA/MoeB/ThiF family protein [Candidatus Zymogenaceae bacterium]
MYGGVDKEKLNALKKEIERLAETEKTPDGSSVKAIDIAGLDLAAKSQNVTRRRAEIAALDLGIYPVRYMRNIGTLGREGQKKLLNSRVSIVGVGGLGGTAAIELARAGVGELVLIDGDVFSEDNLNRQEFSDENVIHASKVKVAQKRIEEVNGAVDVTVVEKVVDELDLRVVLTGSDAVLDALDNISGRFALQRAAQTHGIPLVHGSVAGFIGQVSTILSRDRGLSAIYGPEEETPDRGIELEVGTPPGVVGAVASIQVIEVLKILTGIGEPLHKRLLFMDFEKAIFKEMTL